MRVFDDTGQPVYRDYVPWEELPPGWSVKPFFPGYKYELGVSTYRGEEIGEGGYVYAEPGIHCNVALLDVASMHPSSIVAETLFGDYTKNFNDLLQTRVYIKHKEYDKAAQLFGGKLAPYLQDKDKAKQLSQALKIAINSVYGLTSASFENPFRDERNKDNIVAKRGALFMVNLKHEVQKRGFTVAHIKTDSIKIPNATNEIIRFVMDYGKEYGYSFEHEATYEKMCLVNDAVYIARFARPESCEKAYGYAPEECREAYDPESEIFPLRGWTATGTQFQVPYVFKTLFSHEEIAFKDMCETKSVSSALYLDRNNAGKEEDYEFIGRVGLFCPMKAGIGGTLYRKTEDKKTGKTGWANATGTKGWYWLEAEEVTNRQLENEIDRGYYWKLVDEAKTAIANYGDVERFLADEPYWKPLEKMNKED